MIYTYTHPIEYDHDIHIVLCKKLWGKYPMETPHLPTRSTRFSCDEIVQDAAPSRGKMERCVSLFFFFEAKVREPNDEDFPDDF